MRIFGVLLFVISYGVVAQPLTTPHTLFRRASGPG